MLQPANSTDALARLTASGEQSDKQDAASCPNWHYGRHQGLCFQPCNLLLNTRQGTGSKPAAQMRSHTSLHLAARSALPAVEWS